MHLSSRYQLQVWCLGLKYTYEHFICFLTFLSHQFLLVTWISIAKICTNVSMVYYMLLIHTCQVGEVQKREISLFATWKRGRFCAKPICDIYLVHQRSNSGWNFENNEIFPSLNGFKLFIWCKNIVFLYLLDTLLTKHCIFIGKINIISSFKDKIKGRRWDPKRGRFPFLGGRWMYRREMGSKRGSLPPKEGDLTCMSYSLCWPVHMHWCLRFCIQQNHSMFISPSLSKATYRDHSVQQLPINVCACPSGSHTLLWKLLHAIYMYHSSFCIIYL